MHKEIQLLNKWLIYIIIFWSSVITFFIFYDLYHSYENAKNEALAKAKTKVQSDINFRQWVASHGGVYVPIDKNSQPNPYLAHLKNRDITTFNNEHLTLINPALALRELLIKYYSNQKYKDKLTSNIVVNPNNAPDKWEKKALNKVIKTEKPYYEIYDKYIRYMYPLKVEKSCLKCHAFQGYRIGDIRGAISVTVDTQPFINKYIALNKNYILEPKLLVENFNFEDIMLHKKTVEVFYGAQNYNIFLFN